MGNKLYINLRNATGDEKKLVSEFLSTSQRKKKSSNVKFLQKTNFKSYSDLIQFLNQWDSHVKPLFENSTLSESTFQLFFSETKKQSSRKVFQQQKYQIEFLNCLVFQIPKNKEQSGSPKHSSRNSAGGARSYSSSRRYISKNEFFQISTPLMTYLRHLKMVWGNEEGIGEDQQNLEDKFPFHQEIFSIDNSPPIPNKALKLPIKMPIYKAVTNPFKRLFRSKTLSSTIKSKIYKNKQSRSDQISYRKNSHDNQRYMQKDPSKTSTRDPSNFFVCKFKPIPPFPKFLTH